MVNKIAKTHEYDKKHIYKIAQEHCGNPAVYGWHAADS